MLFSRVGHNQDRRPMLRRTPPPRASLRAEQFLGSPHVNTTIRIAAGEQLAVWRKRHAERSDRRVLNAFLVPLMVRRRPDSEGRTHAGDELAVWRNGNLLGHASQGRSRLIFARS